MTMKKAREIYEIRCFRDGKQRRLKNLSRREAEFFRAAAHELCVHLGVEHGLGMAGRGARLLLLLLLPAMAGAQQVEFRPGSSGCVDVVVTAAAPFDGAELAWQYSGLQAPSVVAGPDLPAGAFLVINTAPPNGCGNNRPGVAVGIVVGTTPLPAGTYRLLEACHPLPPTIAQLCEPLDFVDCLGAPPILNRLFPGPVDLAEVDGEACFQEKPFRRGDLNGDGAQTIGDAVDILHCLFLQARCPGCLDVADANDDGFADISDVVFLLSWRVGLVPALPPPAGACGSDPTPDQFLCPDPGGTTCAWVDLRWDPPETDEAGTPLESDALAGYRIYSGPASREYDQALDVGLVTATAWMGEPGARRYFAVTALDHQGRESGFSNEVPGARRYFAVTALDHQGRESGFSNEAFKEF